MADYRIAVQARAQILDIEAFTAARFGTYQADAYITGLEKTFELIAAYPRIGRSADELVHGLRRYRYQSHSIYYADNADHVMIRAVFHHAQDLKPELFE